MLVSFGVQNYRSFAARQTLSMAAGTSARQQERFSFASGNSLAPDLLRSVCLFGPNGAGKSALVQALHFFQKFVISSAKDSQEGEKIEISSFRFDDAWRGKPTEMEATFIFDGAYYQYGFAVDEERVWSEWLFTKPNAAGARTRRLFQREYDEDKSAYAWQISKTYVKGAKELWKTSTRANALFLSTAIQLKAEVFRDPFDWIQNFLYVIESPERLSPQFTASQCSKYGLSDQILDLLRAVDIGIEKFDIETKEFDLDGISSNSSSETARRVVARLLGGQMEYQIKSYHQGQDGTLIPLDFEDESDGSRVVFSIAAIWLTALECGFTLVIDELHNSLHPHALRLLVNMFQDPKINANNAQLIFTSHETSVMAKGFMHQDQVWLVEKDDAESSKLIPLSDYKVRDISSFQKAYLDGRYGAVPKLKEYVHG